MTALRIQTGGKHQTRPASLRRTTKSKKGRDRGKHDRTKQNQDNATSQLLTLRVGRDGQANDLRGRAVVPGHRVDGDARVVAAVAGVKVSQDHTP